MVHLILKLDMILTLLRGKGITLRFGYWQKVDFEGLQELLPHYCKVTENIVDEDDDCGTLYNYNITDDRIY